MVEKIKEFLFIIIPISIVATYFGCLGFYLNYNIDISTYINTDDLFIVYSKYTALVIIYSYIIFYSIKRFLENENEDFWWNKTIFKTNFRRKIIIIVLPFIIFFISIFTLEFIASLISISLLTLFLMYVFIVGIKSFNSKIKSKNNENLSDTYVFNIITLLSITSILIPIGIGSFYKKYYEPEKVIIHFESEIIDTYNNPKLIMIGKNSKYFFIYNNENNTSIIYPVDKIKKVIYFNSSK